MYLVHRMKIDNGYKYMHTCYSLLWDWSPAGNRCPNRSSCVVANVSAVMLKMLSQVGIPGICSLWIGVRAGMSGGAGGAAHNFMSTTCEIA